MKYLDKQGKSHQTLRNAYISDIKNLFIKPKHDIGITINKPKPINTDSAIINTGKNMNTEYSKLKNEINNTPIDVIYHINQNKPMTDVIAANVISTMPVDLLAPNISDKWNLSGIINTDSPELIVQDITATTLDIINTKLNENQEELKSNISKILTLFFNELYHIFKK